MAKPKLAILTTVSMTIKVFYKGQIKALNKAGIETTVICAEDPDLKNFLPNETIFLPVGFTRLINPLADIKVLWKLFRLFRREKYTLVQYSTLKASLLGSIASFLACTPIRIYLLWGLYYEGQTNIKRSIFKFFEKIICFLSTVIIPDSREVIDFLEKEAVVKKTKCEFILNGSACGIDIEEFCPERWQNEGNSIRHKVGIPDESIVIGIFGRLTGDKGVNEIVTAFVKLADEMENLFLLIVGVQEEKDRLRPETVKIMESHPRIKCLGWQKTLLPCWAAIDIYCLPSYREGFPQSPLESQAMKKPAICTNIMGCRESVVQNETGFLVEPKSTEALLEPLRKLIMQPELRKKMGEKGRERIKQMFDSRDVTRAMVEHRLNLMISHFQRKNNMKKSSKPQMAVLTTVSSSIKTFFKEQLEALNLAGIKVTVICANDPDMENFLPDGTAFIPVDFTRRLNPLKDIKVLYNLFRIFRQIKFDLVQYSTPKAALIGSIAAYLTRVPVRIYALWGLYYETQKGLARWILKQIERLTCRLSTHVVPIAKELITILEKERLAKASKCQVLHNGSTCGIDMEEFCPERWQNEGISLRHKVGIPDESIVIGVFGRLTGDKGVNEIVTAFVKLADEMANLFLLMVGVQEEEDRLRPETVKIMESHPRIKCLGWQKIAPCWAAIDIYCLPTYREGFSQLLLEAQAMKKPVVGTNIAGCRESVANNETGFLVEPKSAGALLEPLRRLVMQPELRKQMGEKGRKRVEQMFDSKDVTRVMVEHRLKLLRVKC